MKLRYFIIAIAAMMLGCVWAYSMIALLTLVINLDVTTKVICITVLICISSLIFAFEK